MVCNRIRHQLELLYFTQSAALAYLPFGPLRIAAALGGSIGFKIYESEKVAYAIVLTASLDARNEPDGATVLFTAHEGTKFRIRKTVDDWALVSLPNGVSGWVERKALGII